MTLASLKTTLEALDEKSCSSGTYRVPERLALALPDGDVGAVDDPGFVDWLLAHAETAPFGQGGKTKIDKTVRHAHRVKGRDKIDVAGFEPAAILDEIEAALSPRWHLAAKLTDVLVYPEGGKFDRHKDTPRTDDLVGTLVVGLPIAHEGGAFVVDDGRDEQVFDWSGKAEPMTVRWVALYSDVDHEIRPVTSGARVTLVYSLHHTDKPREDVTWKERAAKLRGAIGVLASQAEWPVMIACTRHVITDGKQPQPVTALRGFDRDLADVLVEAGYQVAVRACMTAEPIQSSERPPRFPTDLWAIARLKKPVTTKDVAKFGDIVTFAETVSFDDDYDDIEFTSLAPHILDHVPMQQWVVRANAAATMIHEADMFSEEGYFGNEGYDAFIYTLAALEVRKR